MLNIFQAETSDHMEEARKLFCEYEKWLGFDLCFQGFEDELQGLPGRYSQPEGRLLLASVDENMAGCVALRKLEDDTCEMKRLYLREGFRGLGLSNSLIEKLIDDSRLIGYSRMRLDTYPPKMGKAVRLYESHGFKSIPPYYANPHDDVLFMELVL